MGQFNWTVRARHHMRALMAFFHCLKKKLHFFCFDFKKSLMYHNRPIWSVIILEIKQIRLKLRGRPILLITRIYDYRPNWTPLSPVTNANNLSNN